MAGVMITDQNYQNDQYDQTHSKWKTVKISETDLVSKFETQTCAPKTQIYSRKQHILPKRTCE